MIKPFLAGLVLFCALAAAPVQTEKNATDLNASQIPLEKQISTDSTLHKKK